MFPPACSDIIHVHVCSRMSLHETHTHAHTYTHTHRHTYTHTHTHVHTQTCTHTHKRARTHTHACTHTCMHVHAYTHARARTHKHTHIHTHTHTHTHTQKGYPVMMNQAGKMMWRRRARGKVILVLASYPTFHPTDFITYRAENTWTGFSCAVCHIRHKVVCVASKIHLWEPFMWFRCCHPLYSRG